MTHFASLKRRAAPSLLVESDPPAYTVENPGGQAPALLVCDHASAVVPKRLKRLGLPKEVFGWHIALDLGAADLTRYLSRRFDATAVLCGYSRLVIDCNRKLGDESSIRVESDGTLVPGNTKVRSRDREQRENEIFHSYHGAVTDSLDRLTQTHGAPALIAIHSFTPELAKHGEHRPWHAGVLWDLDQRLSTPVMEFLESQPGIHVGDNQPYSGKHPADFTIDHHGEGRGLPCI